MFAPEKIGSPLRDDLAIALDDAVGGLGLLLLLRVLLEYLEVVGRPVGQLLLQVVLPDVEARQMRHRPENRVLGVGSVEEVVEQRTPGVLLLDVVEDALAEVRADIGAGHSAAGIHGLVVAAGIHAFFRQRKILDLSLFH